MSKPVVTLSAIGPDGKTWEVHVCPKCRRTCLDARHAERCCEPTICDCGEVCTHPWTACDDCRTRKAAEREQALIDKAARVPWKDYDGPVSDGDRYWHTVQDYIEEHLDDDESLPSHVWGCTISRLTLNAQQIIEAELESQEHHEDAYDSLDDIDGLQKLLDEWCAKQTMESWVEDSTTAVVLDGAEQEYRGEASPGNPGEAPAGAGAHELAGEGCGGGTPSEIPAVGHSTDPAGETPDGSVPV